jgi:hypothetical protein
MLCIICVQMSSVATQVQGEMQVQGGTADFKVERLTFALCVSFSALPLVGTGNAGTHN